MGSPSLRGIRARLIEPTVFHLLSR